MLSPEVSATATARGQDTVRNASGNEAPPLTRTAAKPSAFIVFAVSSGACCYSRIASRWSRSTAAVVHGILLQTAGAATGLVLGIGI